MSDLPVGLAVLRRGTGELIGPLGVARVVGRQLHLAEVLLAARGRSISRAMLADMMWAGNPDCPEPKTISVFACHLRRKLRTVGSGAELLGVWGNGYSIRLPETGGVPVLLSVAQSRLLPRLVVAARHTDEEVVKAFLAGANSA